jgi:hypothetical protein
MRRPWAKPPLGPKDPVEKPLTVTGPGVLRRILWRIPLSAGPRNICYEVFVYVLHLYFKKSKRSRLLFWAYNSFGAKAFATQCEKGKEYKK